MKVIHKSYKFKIAPDNEQIELLAKHFGACRFVFNRYLNSRKEIYLEENKSEIADINNIGYGPYAGAIIGAAFLKKFVEKTPWTHLDIAGTAWWEKARYYTPKCGTGFGIRLMIEYLKSLS